MADDPATPQYVDITPSPAGFRMMRQAMAESITTYTTDIEQIAALSERLNEGNEYIFFEGSVTNQEVDWLQEGLQLLIQQKEASITTLQGGIEEIDRCYPPEAPLPLPGI